MKIYNPMALWGQPLTREQTDAVIRGAWDAIQLVRDFRLHLTVRHVELLRDIPRADASDRHFLECELRDVEALIERADAAMQQAGVPLRRQPEPAEASAAQ